jgi:RecB family endonuclease NucS
MRVVVALCSVVYTGRGDTVMEPAVRAIIIKDDGSVAVHNDQSNKPLNYMGKGNIHTVEDVDGVPVWNFDTRKENLKINMLSIYSDSSVTLDENDPGLIRDGTEDHLQAWLAENPEALGEGFTLVAREYPTGAGPVDLLVKDADGMFVAVEVKRVAMIGALDQVRRYVEALAEDESFAKVRGIVAALDVRPNTLKLAEKRQIQTVLLPTDWRNH